MRFYVIAATAAILFTFQLLGQDANAEQSVDAGHIVEPVSEQAVSEEPTSEAPASEDPSSEKPVSEEPHESVYVIKPGERQYLSPNLIGLQNIAMTFLPLSMNFVNIIDAFREISNAIRYEILVNAVDTENNNTDIICYLVILEKPWQRTQWDDRIRELQHSNCTLRESPVNTTPLPSSDVNDKYVGSTVFNGGSRRELSANNMKYLEDQIISSASSYNRIPANKFITPSAGSTENSVFEDQDQQEVFNASTIKQDIPETSQYDNETVTQYPTSTEDTTIADTTNDISTTELPPSQESTTMASDPNVLGDDDMNWLDVFFSIDGSKFIGEKYPQEQIEDQLDYVIVEETLDNDEARKQLEESLSKLAGSDVPSYKISKIHSATKKFVVGTLTKINCQLIDADGKEQQCIVEILAQIWKKKDSHEVTINCENKSLVKRRHSRSVDFVKKESHKEQKLFAWDLFFQFKIKYNRQYENSNEEKKRFKIFNDNLKIIEQLTQHEMGSAKYGITEFADLTSSEFKQRANLWQRDPVKAANIPKAVIPDINMPKEFDWRSKGVVSPVKDQGNCGSCWAFSTIGNIEGLNALKTGKLLTFSEQELLDCDTTDSACRGGLMDNAFEAINKIGGLELESEYPYHARKQKCQFNKTMSHVKVKSYVDLPKNETAMAQWLVANGPISIGLNALAMQFYRGGVSHPISLFCSKYELNHGVLIVGYGVSEYPSFNKVIPYWIIKNSWGSKWGEQGYYRVYRGDNTCGVSEMAASAVLDN